jgi:hypothetical protein
MSIIAGIIGSTVLAAPPPVPNTFLEVMQWLGDYSGGGANGDFYILLSDYPTAGDIPVGAEALISDNGTPAQVIVESNVLFTAYGESIRRIVFVNFDGAIYSATTGSFGWYVAPTYTLNSDGSVDEGGGLTFTASGTNVPDGTYYWTIQTGSGDFTTTSGSLGVTNNYGSFIVAPDADSTTEGSETFTVALRRSSVNGPILVISDPVTINDTSLTGQLTAFVDGWNIDSDSLQPDVAGNPNLAPVVAGYTVTGPLGFTATVVGTPFSNGTNWVIPVNVSLDGFTSSNQGNYTFTPPA